MNIRTDEHNYLIGYLTGLASRGMREDNAPMSAHLVSKDGTSAPYFRVVTEHASYRVTVEPEGGC